MIKKIIFVVLLVLIAAPQLAGAEKPKPLQLAIFNPYQLVPEEDSIAGARLSLFYTVNKDVTGLSLVWLGVNRTTGDFKGIEWGLGNFVEGSCFGWQAGVVNYTAKRFVGLQYGMANVTVGDLTGIQWGIVNYAEGFVRGNQCGVLNISKSESKGINVGVVNYSEGTFRGLQGGFVNYAAEMHGLQLGLVNYTKSLDGFQIGLGNYNGNKKPMEFSVLINWSF